MKEPRPWGSRLLGVLGGMAAKLQAVGGVGGGAGRHAFGVRVRLASSRSRIAGNSRGRRS